MGDHLGLGMGFEAMLFRDWTAESRAKVQAGEPLLARRASQKGPQRGENRLGRGERLAYS